MCPRTLFRTRSIQYPYMSTKAESISQDTFSLKDQCHEICCFWFFRESSSPDNSIRVISRIFSTIRGDICNSRCTTGVNCPFKPENLANRYSPSCGRLYAAPWRRPCCCCWAAPRTRPCRCRGSFVLRSHAHPAPGRCCPAYLSHGTGAGTSSRSLYYYSRQVPPILWRNDK
jgi:hypothetical protein